MNRSVQEAIEKQLSLQIMACSPVGGGSINVACMLETSGGLFFVKTNSANRLQHMFEREAQGLQLLAQPGCIGVPEVIVHGEAGDTAYLVLEWLEHTTTPPHYWQTFGRQLAALHRNTNPTFGLDQDNYIGSLVQSNSRANSWADFFATERLLAQGYLASRELGTTGMKQLEAVCRKLPDLFPEEPAALLHGDLWSGNYVTGPDGKAWIVDPAVYYGHREMDLAMSRLFGGFSPEFYEAYDEAFPLAAGWLERVELCNLYPLLVHVNLFGGSYAGQVLQILQRFA